MADPMAHIKDAYYFEVPKFLWRPNYESLEDVPEFLREAHPEASLSDFEHALAGKVLIPQPFGAKLKNLYEKESGFALSKFMVMELVAALLLIAIFVPLARRARAGDMPRGHGWNLFEAFLVFLRDQVARPAIGKHDADRFLPLLWTMFFFILACNLLGLVPWAGSATGALATTGTLAIVTFLTVIGSGMYKLGPIGFWKAQVPHVDLPLPLAVVLIPMIFAIEVMGIFIKHVILAVRLLANMMAGHLVLAVIVGFIAASAGSMAFWGVMPASILGATALSLLELFVAFLQAYIFTFLSALFIGMAVHPH
jgi:F-type H+-transporting ATPase subunit a